jgi:hypothetical protein
LDSAELHHAYLWDCPSCGREQILRLRVIDDPTPGESPGSTTIRSSYETPAQCRDCGAWAELVEVSAGLD